jgi:HK97 family phage portal protein
VRILGRTLTWGTVRSAVTRRTAAFLQKAAGLDLVTNWPSSSGSSWWPIIREGFPGAWQRRAVTTRTDIVRYGTVWACVTLIAADIAKLWIKLVEEDARGICTTVTSPAYSPVLRKPNHFQTRVKFFESWVLSRLITGNAYILKERNHRGGQHQGNVTALYVLDPSRVQVLVAPDGAVFYDLGADNLSGLEESVRVPASEIIHDICVPLFHPLIGVSPLFASGLAATQGLRIQENSTKFAENGSNLSGILTAPTNIPDDLAKRIQQHWDENFGGPNNVGKVAVLGSGLEFKPMMMTAVDAQMIDQLKWTDAQICATYHVPGYMVGVGAAPPYTDIQSINLQYYTQALQNPIENMELLLEEGLELPPGYGIEFDLDALARMDKKTQIENATNSIKGSLDTINGARASVNLAPVAGGDTIWMQQQNFSLEALTARDKAGPPPVIAVDVSDPNAMATIWMSRLLREFEARRLMRTSS